MRLCYLPLFLACFIVIMLHGAHSASADVRLAQIFGDNMVLQRNVAIPIWGWSDAGDEIVVRARSQTVRAITDANGKWSVQLEPMRVGKPFTLTIMGSHNRVELENVVIGEVWICSGQSNMEWPVRASANPVQEKQAAQFPSIRHVKIERSVSTLPKSDVKNLGWKVCSPETVSDFTAVGYYFGRELHRELDVPIGLINSTWGGTIVEAWTSGSSLKTHPDFKKKIKDIEASEVDMAAAEQEFQTEIKSWQERYEQAVKASDRWATPHFDDRQWKTLQAPGQWEQQGFAKFDGIAWYRRSITIPEAWLGQELTLSLARIDDRDRTFFNGREIGSTRSWNVHRSYKIPAAMNVDTEVQLAVQVHDTGGAGGFHGDPQQMNIRVAQQTPLSLAGAWKFKTTELGQHLAARPQPPGFNGPNHPTALFNAMIHPLVPFAHRGSIWYQGEANARRGHQYQTLFPLLIRDWRKQWKRDLPFYWVQLANFRAVVKTPQDSDWAELREAQSMTRRLPATGEAIIIDIGDARDIHPKNKQDVGRRLALLALNHDYGFNIPFSGPRFQSMNVEGNSIRLSFEYPEGLASSDAKPLSQFAIAGKDQTFYWADARVEENEVVLTSSEVTEPVAARYAWANNPEGCNLTNASGLPAAPFRTDDWPGVTYGKK